MLLHRIPGTSGALEPYVSDEAFSLGHLLAVNSAGRVVRASSSIAGGLHRVIGVAFADVGGAGITTNVFTVQGRKVAILFGSAPGGGDNGKPVFLSMTAGLGVLVPPAVDGNVVVPVGILQGANGVDTAPDVVFNKERSVFVED